jgi:hypothetical protein
MVSAAEFWRHDDFRWGLYCPHWLSKCNRRSQLEFWDFGLPAAARWTKVPKPSARCVRMSCARAISMCEIDGVEFSKNYMGV